VNQLIKHRITGPSGHSRHIQESDANVDCPMRQFNETVLHRPHQSNDVIVSSVSLLSGQKRVTLINYALANHSFTNGALLDQPPTYRRLFYGIGAYGPFGFAYIMPDLKYIIPPVRSVRHCGDEGPSNVDYGQPERIQSRLVPNGMPPFFS